MLLRWARIITGVAWIGASFHFASLDNSLTPPKNKADIDKGVGGEQWGLHGVAADWPLYHRAGHSRNKHGAIVGIQTNLITRR